MKVEIRVDRGRCIGSGQCVHWAPGVFDQDDAAIAVVVDPRGEPEERIVHAVTSCPAQAISLYVGGTRVEADDLRDWVTGIHCSDPIVPLLEQLGDDHHELRAALAAVPAEPEATRAEEVCSLTSAHLRNEEQVYAAMTALVGPRLVDAFEDDHARIEEALRDVGAQRSDPVARGRAMRELARAVDDHIRLEETVLFPATLAALASRPSPQGISALQAPG